MNIYEVLKELGIKYEEISHKAVFTIKEALDEEIPKKIAGVECKNLFLKFRDKYFLVVIEASKRVDLKSLSSFVNVPRLSFASSEDLEEILELTGSSVTPLGIINDEFRRVELLFDKDLKDKKILVHPLVNTKTMAIKWTDLVKFVEWKGSRYYIF